MEFIEKALKVKLTFTEEVLGLSPASKEVYRDYIASKAPDAPTVADEIEAVGVDETADGKMTVFPRKGMARLRQTCGDGAVAKLRQGTLYLGRNKVNRNGIAQTGKGRKWNEAEVRRRDMNGSGIE
jgi:hypothetical protein